MATIAVLLIVLAAAAGQGQNDRPAVQEQNSQLSDSVFKNVRVLKGIPTQIDYADYREVAGVKLPFRTTVTWRDGQNTFSPKDVRPNVPIDPAKFSRPAPFKRR